MGKKIIKKEVYSFKKGDKLHLDDLHEIQGIGGNEWWEHEFKDESCEIIITRDHNFTITFYE